MSAEVRELRPPEEAEAMAIRIKVFVEEQNVPLQEEYDDYDKAARHFGVFLNDLMVGTGRLLVLNGRGKIGRVAILKKYRGRGLGRLLLENIIAAGREQSLREFVIDAQLQAIDFYTGLGFRAEGEVFLDGGLPHRVMRLHLDSQKED